MKPDQPNNKASAPHSAEFQKDDGQRRTQLLYVNNLRLLLIILIVMLHIAITYGAEGSWYYSENTNDIATGVILTLFNAIVQSFVLGFFFMISGYFTPHSYDRKGAASFIKDRLLRLGIPFFVYFFVVSPILTYTLYVRFMARDLDIASMFGSGPLWFVQLLFTFAFCYAIWRRISGRPSDTPRQDAHALGHGKILIFAIALSLANFLVRMWFPLGTSFSNLQFSYFPGYISLFIVGIAAHRNRWFENFSDSVGRTWLWVAIATVMLFPVIVVFGGALDNIAPFRGGVHWQSMILCTWEAFVGTGIIAGLFVIFRRRFDHQGHLAKTMANNAYAVYVIHAPVIVFFTYSLRNAALHPLLKFVFVSVSGVSLCFLTSQYVVRRIPGAKAIL